MKKIFTTIVSLIFLLTFSLALVGCQKAEEPKKAEPAKQEAPAPAAPEPAKQEAPAPAAPEPAAPEKK
jgi:hypothetical protein